PSFSRRIRTTLSSRKGYIDLYFYVPVGYEEGRLEQDKYSVLVHFHGGGFTLGRARDDARWCQAVVEKTGAVVVNVDYRRAPQYPCPIPMEDGCDAVLWIIAHADELNLDLARVATGGFSSGGNLAVTVPLRLQEELAGTGSPLKGGKAIERDDARQRFPADDRSKQINFIGMILWYPTVDYSITREQKRQAVPTDPVPEFMSTMFNESYLQPPVDLMNPFVSPGRAPSCFLATLPKKMVILCCEIDMLRPEVETFRDRLVSEQGKEVVYHCIPDVQHAFDKAPNPLRLSPVVAKYYSIACGELAQIFAGNKINDC
ncbi:hypothetical protein NA57DRAFT_48678, partial [Rhizodiscina lignyota]